MPVLAVAVAAASFAAEPPPVGLAAVPAETETAAAGVELSVV